MCLHKNSKQLRKHFACKTEDTSTSSVKQRLAVTSKGLNYDSHVSPQQYIFN